jgi:hypothetical protein
MPSALRIALILTLAAGLSSVPAGAQTLIGVTQNWSAYQATTPDGKVCYALSSPTAILPVKVSRDPIYFIVSFWPARKVDGELEVVPGYPYKDGAPVFAEVGTVKTEFFTRNDNNTGAAWVKEPGDESALLAAMRGGSKMVVTGLSRRGTHTTDTYSLNGLSAAMNAAMSACSK